MALLRAGVDTSVIALWLGHQGAATTHICPRPRPRTEHEPWTLPAPDDLIDFLERL